MNQLLRILPLLALLVITPRALPAAPPPSTTVSKVITDAFFDGSTLTNWYASKPGHWSVDNREIVGKSTVQIPKNSFLISPFELSDFRLTFEVRLKDNKGNSGVQFRSIPYHDSMAGYQADIGPGWWGKLYEEHGRAVLWKDGAEKHVKKGNWNTYEIVAVGDQILTAINGHASVNYRDNGKGRTTGRIALQLHSGGPTEVRFRKFHIELNPKPELRTVTTKAAPDATGYGFESGDLAGWTATGTAFNGQPVRGNTVTPRTAADTSNHAGSYWIGGYEIQGNDQATGTLTSDPITVEKAFSGILVGGGDNPGTRVEIVHAKTNKIIDTARGKRVENMTRHYTNLSAYLGQKILIRIVDEDAGAWGHINFDDLCFYDAKPISRVGRLNQTPILKHLEPNPNQKPGGANDTVAGMWMPKGFQVDLIASEPQLTQPIAFTIDEKSRIWAIQAHAYPNREIYSTKASI